MIKNQNLPAWRLLRWLILFLVLEITTTITAQQSSIHLLTILLIYLTFLLILRFLLNQLISRLESSFNPMWRTKSRNDRKQRMFVAGWMKSCKIFCNCLIYLWIKYSHTSRIFSKLQSAKYCAKSVRNAKSERY